jgi:hypothetical protein
MLACCIFSWSMDLFLDLEKVMSNENDHYIFRKEVNRIPIPSHR